MTGTDPDAPDKRPDARALDLLRRTAAGPDTAGPVPDEGPATPMTGAGARPSVVIAPNRPAAPSRDVGTRASTARRVIPAVRNWAIQVRERSGRAIGKLAPVLERLSAHASAVQGRRLSTSAALLVAVAMVATAIPSTTLFDLDIDDPAAEGASSGTRGIAIARGAPPPPPAVTAPPNPGAERGAGASAGSGPSAAPDDRAAAVVPLPPRAAQVESQSREATARAIAPTDAGPAFRPARRPVGSEGAAPQPPIERSPAVRRPAPPADENAGRPPSGPPGRLAGSGNEDPAKGGGPPNASRRVAGGAPGAQAAAGPAGGGAADGQSGGGRGQAIVSASPGGSRGQAPGPSEPALPEECPAEAPKEPVVLVFDGSVSMGLPLDMPLDLESELDSRMERGDNDARLEYRRWLAMDLPKRIETAKGAVNVMLAEADPQIRIGAVAFTGCLEIATHPVVPFGARNQIGGFIGNVAPHRGGATPLTASVQAALDLLSGSDGGGRARIVVMTDGQETCAGDPCALAADIAKKRPGVRVDVLDMSGRSNAACLAEATGGLVLNHAGVRGRISLSSLLVRTANQCAVSAKSMEPPRQ